MSSNWFSTDGVPEAAAAHMSALLLLSEDQDVLSQAVSYPFTSKSPAPNLSQRQTFSPSPCMCMTIELDSFEAAKALIHSGWSRPAVLNMANEYNCGGAWCTKTGSQEEDLFRRSSLPLSLWPRRRTDDARLPEFDQQLPRKESVYPFTEAMTVYSGSVDVTTSSPPFRVSVLSAAAQDLRAYRRLAGAPPFSEELTRQKLRSILWCAWAHGHRSIVLGAHGCGAFQNNPNTIARIFAELLGPGGEFSSEFGVVVFAIIKSKTNLEAFSSVFPRADSIPAPPPVASAGANAPDGVAPNGEVPLWEYEGDKEEWEAFHAGHSAILEASAKGGIEALCLERSTSRRTFVYEINLTAMTQRNTMTGKIRSIRRKCAASSQSETQSS